MFKCSRGCIPLAKARGFSHLGELYKRTTWNRISSGFNAFTMPATLIYPFYLLEVYFSMMIGVINMFIWIGIFLYRNP